MFHKSALDPEDHASWTASNRVFDPRSQVLRATFNVSLTGSDGGMLAETFQKEWDAVVAQRNAVAEEELDEVHFNAWWENAKRAASPVRFHHPPLPQPSNSTQNPVHGPSEPPVRAALPARLRRHLALRRAGTGVPGLYLQEVVLARRERPQNRRAAFCAIALLTRARARARTITPLLCYRPRNPRPPPI